MNTKVLLATIAGAVVLFFSGWLVFGILLNPYYQSILSQEGIAAQRSSSDMKLWVVALNNVVYAYLLTIIFSKWANISTFRGGIMAGGVISFLITLSFDLSLYSMYKIWHETSILALDPLANGLIGSITGGTIGWVLGYRNSN